MNIAGMSIWLRPLGWALFHSLWQGFIFCLICKCIFVLLRKQAQARYLVACIFLGLLFLTFIITFAYLLQFQKQVIFSPGALPWGGSVASGEPNFWWSAASLEHILDQSMILLVPCYLVILGFLSFSMLRTFTLMGKYGDEKYQKYPGQEMVELFAEACKIISTRKPVQLFISELVASPLTYRYFKPLVLIPAGMMAQLSPEQVEAIFIHELAHIKRHDYLVNLFQAAIETLLFFNPFSLILSSMIRTERENCCDDLVMAAGAEPLVYAHALLSLEESRLTTSPLAMGLGSRPGQLYLRIRRLTGSPVPAPVTMRILLAVLLLVTAMGSYAYIQAPYPKTRITGKTSERGHWISDHADSFPEIAGPRRVAIPAPPAVAPPTVCVPTLPPAVAATPARPAAIPALVAPADPSPVAAKAARPAIAPSPALAPVSVRPAPPAPPAQPVKDSSFLLYTRIGKAPLTLQITDEQGHEKTIILHADTLITPDGQVVIKGMVNQNELTRTVTKKISARIKAYVNSRKFKNLQVELSNLTNLKIDTREIKKACEQINTDFTLNLTSLHVDL